MRWYIKYLFYPASKISNMQMPTHITLFVDKDVLTTISLDLTPPPEHFSKYNQYLLLQYNLLFWNFRQADSIVISHAARKVETPGRTILLCAALEIDASAIEMIESTSISTWRQLPSVVRVVIILVSQYIYLPDMQSGRTKYASAHQVTLARYHSLPR